MIDFKIIWKGTDGNFFAKRRDSFGKEFRPEVHVIHIMQGTLEGTDAYFNNPGVQASTHYGIGKNGEIHQYVRDEDAAWGNGIVTNPNWEYLKKYPNVNPNLYTLSYELEGMTGQAPTQEQFEALLYLLNLKSKTYDIPMEKERFIGHYIIDPVNRSRCPGSGFPWAKLYVGLGIDVNVIDLPVILFGSVGNAVTHLQNFLNRKGYNCGIADGFFGKNTLNALIRFQNASGLVPDGICGPLTWAKLQ